MPSTRESHADRLPDDTEPQQPHARIPHPLPQSIGPYRVIEVIGEGGMGIVYKAEQREPVRRLAAIKVIKLGMDTREVIARFDAELQALALMSHPNVAKVFEAGFTDNGRPYFAMEFVPGVSITSYCDTQKLTTRERLELFIPVCQAVQHAHQKGVIHRDLKPGNILITLFDGKPVPKVIDFGVAKATSIQLTEHTLFTRAGTVIGTFEYMSPEQATSSGLDVDTRTDVYSLGVILYQLLTGSLPFDPETLRDAGVEQRIRIIQDTDPPRPSLRLTNSVQPATPGNRLDSTEIARRHRTDPHSLRRELQGDLDWIVLRAMEKDRTRRYETASELASEIERHLNDEPVAARPPSTTYRVGKLIRRHRVFAAAAVSTLTAILIGLAAATYGFFRANQQRILALAATDEANHQKQIAIEERAAAQSQERKAIEAKLRAERASSFVQDVLWMLSSESVRLQPLRMLDEWAKKVQSGALAGDPAAEARVRAMLGRRFAALGFYQKAIPQFRAALDLTRTLNSGSGNPDLATGLNDLSDALVTEANFRAALPLVKESLSLQDRGPNSAIEPRATTLDLYGSVLAGLDDWQSAEPLFQQAWDLRRADSTDSRGLADSLCHHGDMLLHHDDLSGQRFIENALAMYRRVFASQPTALIGPLRRMARTAMARGDWSGADHMLPEAPPNRLPDLGLLRDSVEAKSGRLRSQPNDAALLVARGELYGRLGEYDRAAADFSRAIDLNPPGDSLLWHKLLPSLLQSGQIDLYLSRRHRALQLFAPQTSDMRAMHRIAKDSLSRTIDGEDLDQATKMARQAQLLNPTEPFYFQTMGLAEFRSGHFENAIQWLMKSRNGEFVFRDMLADFYIAMSYARLHDPGQASLALDRGAKLWEGYASHPGEVALEYYEDWALCNQAFQEATATLKSVSAAQATIP